MIPKWEPTRIIARRNLRDFWEAGHAGTEQPLRAWFAEVSRASWQRMADIEARYPQASVADAEWVVSDIGGNKSRLVVKVWFTGQAVHVKFVGTHADDDKVEVGSL